MRFDKGATSQDNSVAKVADFAAQSFLEREFAFFLLNDLLNLVQVKGRPVLIGGQSAPQKQMLAILDQQFLPAGGLGQIQNGPELLLGDRGILGQRLGITAVAILLGVCAQGRANRVEKM
jgi:hypothetical protein